MGVLIRLQFLSLNEDEELQEEINEKCSAQIFESPSMIPFWA